MPGEASDIERKVEASLICALAMAADTIHGFRGKKHWFPSKVFSLNATSLTMLAVAMKLPVDLTTRMYAATDRLAKICSLAFMSTAMANFMTSLGSMEDKDMLMNVTALAILVVTVVVQVIQMRRSAQLLSCSSRFSWYIFGCDGPCLQWQNTARSMHSPGNILIDFIKVSNLNMYT